MTVASMERHGIRYSVQPHGPSTWIWRAYFQDRTLTGSADLRAIAALDALNMIDRTLKSDKAQRRKSITMPHRIVRLKSMK
jgi:hypothetical protein